MLNEITTEEKNLKPFKLHFFTSDKNVTQDLMSLQESVKKGPDLLLGSTSKLMSLVEICICGHNNYMYTGKFWLPNAVPNSA